MKVWPILAVALPMLIQSPPPANVPRAEISGSRIRATLYLPDPGSGYYRGTRFDWSGVIASLQWDGHEYFGQWFDRYDPTLHDAITGPVEEFLTGDSSLGYAEAKPGEPFVRIGVGAVRRKDEEPYQRFETYDIVDPGKWTIANGATWIEFTHELGDTGGYAYVYRKTLQRERRHAGARALAPRTPAASASRRASTTTTSSRSTARRPGRTSSSGSRSRRGRSGSFDGAAEVRGNDVVFLRQFEAKQTIFTELDGFGGRARLRLPHREPQDRRRRASHRRSADPEAVLLVGLEDRLPRTLHRRQRRSRQDVVVAHDLRVLQGRQILTFTETPP